MVAIKEAIRWLSSISSWASATIICDGKSLILAVSNANSVDTSVTQLRTAAAAHTMLKSILIVWAPGHCGLPGNELSHHQAKLGASETQPDNSLNAATRRALFRRSWRPPPIQHDRLMEVYTSLLDEQIKRSFSKPNVPTCLPSIVVSTLLFDAYNNWLESLRMPSADCAVRKSSQQNTYGYGVQHSWRNNTLVTIQLTNSSAFHTQLQKFWESSSGACGNNNIDNKNNKKTSTHCRQSRHCRLHSHHRSRTQRGGRCTACWCIETDGCGNQWCCRQSRHHHPHNPTIHCRRNIRGCTIHQDKWTPMDDIHLWKEYNISQINPHCLIVRIPTFISHSRIYRHSCVLFVKISIEGRQAYKAMGTQQWSVDWCRQRWAVEWSIKSGT